MANHRNTPEDFRIRTNSWRLKLALAAASAVVGMLTAELGLRLIAAAQTRRQLHEIAGPDRRFVPPDGETRLGHIIKPSLDARIVYELIPGTDTVFKDASLLVNPDGFRGPKRTLEKPPRTVRILGIGDSVMFGWGVEEEETYLSLLVDELNATYPEVEWEYINTAVPGYNTSMELAVLETRGLDYDPDIVIVGYVPNDLNVPNFLLNTESPWSLRRSYLSTTIKDCLRQTDSSHRRIQFKPVELDRVQREIVVPEAYQHMVGLNAYERSMRRIADLCRERGIELLILSHIDHTRNRDRVRGINRNLNIPTVSGEARLARYMHDHQLEDYLSSELTYRVDDPHPSAVWHRLLSDTLVDHLERRGILRDRIQVAQTARAPARAADDGTTPDFRTARQTMPVTR